MTVLQSCGLMEFRVLQWCHPMPASTRRTSCCTRIITLYGTRKWIQAGKNTANTLPTGASTQTGRQSGNNTANSLPTRASTQRRRKSGKAQKTIFLKMMTSYYVTVNYRCYSIDLLSRRWLFYYGLSTKL